MGTKPPSGAQTIDSYEDLLTAFTQIDQRLHRICEGDSPPYIYRNKLYLPASMFAIKMASIGSGGERVGPVNASGADNVVEASAATILTYNIAMALRLLVTPFMSLANGNFITVEAPWVPMVPVTVTADGAGNPPATQLVALSAGKRIDAMIHMKVRTVAGAGQYIHNFREACLTAPAPVTPAWADVVIPHAALETFPGTDTGVRVMTVSAGLNLGIADGANGDWPNNAAITYTGFYRYI